MIDSKPGELKLPRSAGARVLVVDDEPMIRAMTCALLDRMGYHGEAIATGEETVAALARSSAAGHPVSLVLLDLHLAAELGVDICRRIRNEGFDVPVVCMSGSGYPSDPLGADAGFDGSMTKPFSAAQLQACIELHAGQKHSPAAR